MSLQGPDFSLQKQNGIWKAGTGTGEAVTEEMEKLADKLARIRVSAAAGKPPVDFDHELSVQDSFTEYTYRLFELDDGYFVSRSDYTQTFEVAESDYEAIVGKTPTQLVRETGSGAQNPLAGSKDENPLETMDSQKDNAAQDTRDNTCVRPPRPGSRLDPGFRQRFIHPPDNYSSLLAVSFLHR